MPLTKVQSTRALVAVSILLVVVVVFLLTFLGIIGLNYSPSTANSTTTGNGFTRKQLELLEKIKLKAGVGGLQPSEVDNIDKMTKEDVCFEVGCLESALEIIHGLNFSADPCDPEGWLGFVCAERGMPTRGQLRQLDDLAEEHTKILLEEETTDAAARERISDMAKLYYKKCLKKGTQNQENIRYIINYIMNTTGGWPLFTNQTPPVNYSWLDAIADSQFLFKEVVGFTTLFFKVGNVNLNLTTNRILINFGVGRLSFGDTLNYSQLQTTMDSMSETGKLEEHSVDVAQLRAAYQFMENLSTRISQVGGEAEVEELTLPQLQLRTDHYFQDRSRNRNGLPLPAVSINWARSFDRAFAKTGFRVGTDQLTLSLPVVPILRIVEAIELEMMEPQGRQNVFNSLQLNVVLMLLGETTSILESKSSCLDKTTKLFGFSLGKSYLSRYYNGSLAEPRVRDLMEEIRQSFLELLESPPWMVNNNNNNARLTPTTKQFIQEKLTNIKIYLAQPDWLKEEDEGRWSKLEKMYEGLDVSDNSSFAENFLNANAWRLVSGNLHSVALVNAIMVEKRETNTFDWSWNVYLGQSHAQYNLIANDVLLLAGLLRKPVFEVNRPGFMNYAGLGTIIGHEIGHSLTINGRKFDKFGDNSTEHWDPTSLRMYEQWANDTASFYDSVPFQINNNLSVRLTAWNTTINEDLADVLALRATFAAYRKYLGELSRVGKKEKILPGLSSFTPDQLFFMKYAIMWCERPNPDVTDFSGFDHSPSNRRADLPLRLFKQFKTAFNCHD